MTDKSKMRQGVPAKRKRGRPVEMLVEPIPDTPAAIADAILSSPPRKDGDWKYKRQAATG